MGQRRTYQNLLPDSIDPLGVFRHLPRISPMFNPQLNLTCHVEDTRASQSSIFNVGYGRHRSESGSVGENRVVPLTHVGICGDQLWQTSPLVARSEEERMLLSNGDSSSV